MAKNDNNDNLCEFASPSPQANSPEFNVITAISWLPPLTSHHGFPRGNTHFIVWKF